MSAREFEREDRRIQDAWMRKVVRREPVPCDPFVNPCQWRRRSSLLTGAGWRPVHFFLFVNRSSRLVKFTLFIQMREPSRVRAEVILRATFVSHKTAGRAPNLGEATRELPENPYILHRKTMRVRDDLKVRGQRIHVSILSQ